MGYAHDVVRMGGSLPPPKPPLEYLGSDDRVGGLGSPSKFFPYRKSFLFHNNHDFCTQKSRFPVAWISHEN